MSYTTTIPKKNKIFEFSSPSRVPAAATPARARRRRRSARVSSLLTYFLLTSYLLTYFLLTSRFQRRRRTQSDGILVVRSDVFFSKKRRRERFFCVSLSLSLSLSLYSKGLSFSLVVFFVINNTIRALCSMPPRGGGLETDAASISLSL